MNVQKSILSRLIFIVAPLAAFTLFLSWGAPCPTGLAAERQPIIADGARPSSHGDYVVYENRTYGFSIPRHRKFAVETAMSGAVSFVAERASGLRFTPSLSIVKYFYPASSPDSEMMAPMEKKYSEIPYYRLVSVLRPADGKGLVAIREFADPGSRENVYEVALYRRSGDSLFEITWQVPRSMADSDLARRFERCAAGFAAADDLPVAAPSRAAESLATTEAMIRAGNLQAAGKHLEALSVLKDLSRSHPGNLDIALMTGRCHVGLGDYRRAASVYKELSAKHPSDVAVRNLLVDALVQAGDHKSALAECRKALELSGPARDMAKSYLNLGNIFFNMKKYRESLNSYAEGMARFPENPQLHNNAATASMRLGDAASAKTYYSRALKLDPGYKLAMLGLGRLLMAGGEDASAAAEFEKAIASDPLCREAYVSLAAIYRRSGARDKLAALAASLKKASSALYSELAAEFE